MADFNILDPSTWRSQAAPADRVSDILGNAVINGVEDPGLPMPGGPITQGLPTPAPQPDYRDRRAAGPVPSTGSAQPAQAQPRPNVARGTVTTPAQPTSYVPRENVARGQTEQAPAQPEAAPVRMTEQEGLAQIHQALQSPQGIAAITLSEQRGNLLTAGNPVLDDYAALTANEFIQKYGLDAYNNATAFTIAKSEIDAQANRERDPATMVTDGIWAATGAAQQTGLGMVAAVAQAYPDGSLKDAVLDGIRTLSENVGERTHRLQSDALNDRRYIDSIRSALDKQDNDALTQADKADDQNLVDAFASHGREVLRDMGSAGKRMIEDPTIVADMAAEGVGSLLVGGAAGKLVGATARAGAAAITPGLEGTAARAVSQAIDEVAFPVAIGAMEGGDAAMQAGQEVMAMSDAELAQSPAYQRLIQSGMSPEAARLRLASEAGDIALPGAAAVGAATGKLVESIEMAPFARTSGGGLVANAGKEAVEEGIQSGVGQLASNVGVAVSGANPDKNLAEGVGAAAVQGAAAGVGTTVGMQGPGVALRAAGNAALAPFKAAAGAISDRATVLSEQVKAESAVSEQTLSQEVAVEAEKAPVIAEGLRTLVQEKAVPAAQADQAEQFIARVEQAATITEDDLTIMPGLVRETLEGTQAEKGQVNKFDALLAAAVYANDESADLADRVAAATFILKTTETNRQLFEEDAPQFLSQVKEDRPERGAFEQYAGVMRVLAQAPNIQQALDWARQEMQQPDQDLSGVNFAEPAGQQIVAQTVELAAVAPQAVNANVANQILNQKGEGAPALSADDRQILVGTVALAETAQSYAAQADKTGANERIDFVSKQIESESGALGLSLTDHVAGINQAITAGDASKTRARITSLAMFARHMRNKVVAFNTAMTNADRQRVPYQSLGPDGWLPADQYFSVFYNPGTEASERLAKQVHLEATHVALLANTFAKSFPEMGIGQVTVPELAQIPTKSKTATVEERNEKRGSSTSVEPTAPSQATTSGTESTAKQAELPPQRPAAIEEETSAKQQDTEQQTKAEAQPAEDVSSQVAEAATETEPKKAIEKPAENQPVIEDNASAVSDAEIVEAVETFDSETDIESLRTDEVFPNLVQANGRNFFHRSFRLPKVRTSRLVGLTKPLADLNTALSNGANLRAFLGNWAPRYKIDGEAARSVREYLSLGDAVKAKMAERLAAAMNGTRKGQPTNKERLESGVDILRFEELRALNIMEKIGDDYQYNQQLVESAILAGLDWALNAANRVDHMDAQDVAQALGVETVSDDMVLAFNRGMSVDMAARLLADNIRRFWGVQANADALQNHSIGIAEGVAKEVLYGLEAAGLIELGKIETEKTWNRVWFDTRSPAMQEDLKSLDGINTMLADLALVEREPETFDFSPIENVDSEQLRNRMAKLTRQQTKVLQTAQATPHHPNSLVFDFFEAMGVRDFVSLMSGRFYNEGDLKKTHKQMGLNKNHWNSIQGKQRSLVTAYEGVARMMAQSKKAGGLPLYFKHHINRLGRLQMDGGVNPVSDKYAREVFMPTRSVIDVSDRSSPSFAQFAMTIGQGIGLKTEKLFRGEVVNQVVAETMTEGGKFRPLVLALKSWLDAKDAGERGIPRETMNLLSQAGLTMHGIHSLLAVANYERALEQGQDLSQFETFTYLEADGKTNGPINALMLFGSGVITPAFLKSVAKGGAFLGRVDQTLNAHVAYGDGKDLYEAVSDKTGPAMVERARQVAADSEQAGEISSAFQRMLLAIGVDVSLAPDTGEITIGRKATKNPLTITIYGSGKAGIAGKVTNELMKAIYASLSETIGEGKPDIGELIYGDLDADFVADLGLLTSRTVREGQDGWYAYGKEQAIGGDPSDFTFTKDQYEALRANVLKLMVEPMVGAIEESVTSHVTPVTTALQQATQIQSIILKAMFSTRLAKRLAAKKVRKDVYDAGDFFSQKELDDILASLQQFSPSISTGTQNYVMSGGETANLFEKVTLKIGDQDVTVRMPESFSRSLSGDLQTPAFVYGPVLAGVKAIPTFTIGSGDAQMILNYAAEHPEAANRSELIFDGIDMPADAIEDYSRFANQAVFKTWTQDTNPVRAAYESFAAFMKRDPIKALFGEGAVNELNKAALIDLKKSEFNKDRLTDEELKGLSVDDAAAYLGAILERLKNAADETDARRKTFAEFPMSVDQMASGESPHVNKGSIELDANMTDEDLALLMTERYQENLAEIRKESALPPIGKALSELGSVDADSNARVLQATDLPALFKGLESQLSTIQKDMMRQAVKLLAGSDFEIVFGKPSEVRAWKNANDADSTALLDEDISGAIDMAGRRIYVTSGTAETVIHELIHAATFDKVQARYENEKALSQVEKDAVDRIEGLMGEWLHLSQDDDSVDGETARYHAEGTIRANLDAGNKAAAVNEFMAWVLANQDLAAGAGKAKVQNPLLRIIGDVLAAIKTIIWGDTSKGPQVKDDILSNLRFNTRVLMAGPTGIDQVRALRNDLNATALYQSKAFGTDSRLSEIREGLGKRIAAFIEGNQSLASQAYTAKRRAEVELAGQDAKQVTDRFAHFFPELKGMQAYSTFTMIQQVLMTEAELNPNALSRMEDLYAHVIEQLDYTSFMANPDSTDPNDMGLARNQYDMVLGKFETTTDKLGRSSLMSSFLALSMVSDPFRQVLSKLDKPKSDKSNAEGLDGVLENATRSAVDRLSLWISGEGKSANIKDALDRLMHAMINNVGDQRSFIEQTSDTWFTRLNDGLARVIQDTSEKVAARSAAVNRNSDNLVVKAAASVVNAAATVVNEERSKVAAEGLVSALNKTDGWNPVKDLVNDLIGRTEQNAPIFDMISKVRATVQQVRQQFRDELPVKLNSVFKAPVTKDQWTAMFKSLGKTDLALLAGTRGLDGALKAVTDNRHRSVEIDKLEAAIQEHDKFYAPMILEKAQQLANYLVTGDQGTNLLRNADAIGNLLGTSGFGFVNVSDKLIADIDQLVSLYALDRTDAASRKAVAELVRNDREGVEFVLSYLMGQRKDEQAKLLGGVPRFNHYKGYIPSEAQYKGSLIIASEADHAQLVLQGYSRVATYGGSKADTTRGRRAYYFAPVSGQATFHQGVMQTVHQTASGIDPRTGFSTGQVLGGRITHLPTVRSIEQGLKHAGTTKENLLPVFNGAGKVVAYERAADPVQLAALDRSTDLAEMIGAWRGRQAEELIARRTNEQLIDNLYDVWKDGEKAGRKGEFVNIAKTDPKKDPVLAEAVRVIPAQAWEYAATIFGPDRLMVRRDMVLDTLGSRQASIGDAFTGETRWDPKVADQFQKVALGLLGKDAYRKMVGLEQNLQGVVSNVKTTIVVRSVIVPAANMVSNMFQLMNRGVPLRSILSGFPAKAAEIDAYVKRRAKEVDLEADLRAANGRNDTGAVLRLENQLQSIRDSYKRMSIWPLIEAGEFSAISSGKITAEDLALSEGKWSEFIEKKINSLPEPARTTLRYGAVTRDTALFQGLARAVQYGDFIAKAVLYDDQVKRQSIEPKAAIATVNEAFVNYNRLAGRSRQYLESVGLLWFYNYKIRIMKEAVYLMRHQPLRSLLMMASPVGDSPLSDNILAKALDGNLGYSIGPAMGFGGWRLNPWLNLTN